MKNAFFESFNARLRDECLIDHILGNLAEARDIIETWRIENNTERPGSLCLDLIVNKFGTY